jgi:hypothetical protein
MKKPLWNPIRIQLAAIISLLFVLFLNNNYFFGFYGHEAPPLYSGYSDPNCDRTDVLKSPCTYENTRGNGVKTIALVGDSHAAALSDVTLKFAMNSGFNLHIWTRNGCKYVPQSLLSRSQDSLFRLNSPDCLTRNATFIRSLREHKYEKVFISWRSTRCEDNLFAGYCSTEFTDLMESTIKSISRYSEVVVIVSMFEYNDPKFLEPTVLFIRDTSYPHFASWEDLVLEAEDEAANIKSINIPKVTIIDPRDSLCNLRGCYLKFRNEWALMDNNHLSKFGANQLLTPLMNKLG